MPLEPPAPTPQSPNAGESPWQLVDLLDFGLAPRADIPFPYAIGVPPPTPIRVPPPLIAAAAEEQPWGAATLPFPFAQGAPPATGAPLPPLFSSAPSDQPWAAASLSFLPSTSIIAAGVIPEPLLTSVPSEVAPVALATVPFPFGSPTPTPTPTPTVPPVVLVPTVAPDPWSPDLQPAASFSAGAITSPTPTPTTTRFAPGCCCGGTPTVCDCFAPGNLPASWTGNPLYGTGPGETTLIWNGSTTSPTWLSPCITVEGRTGQYQITATCGFLSVCLCTGGPCTDTGPGGTAQCGEFGFSECCETIGIDVPDCEGEFGLGITSYSCTDGALLMTVICCCGDPAIDVFGTITVES